jgi:hypothetical protein
VHRLRVRLVEDDDGGGGVLVDIGRDDLALLLGDDVEFVLELIEGALVLALHEQCHGIERAGSHYLLGERLDLLEDRLVASEQGEFGLQLSLRDGES